MQIHLYHTRSSVSISLQFANHQLSEVRSGIIGFSNSPRSLFHKMKLVTSYLVSILSLNTSARMGVRFGIEELREDKDLAGERAGT